MAAAERASGMSREELADAISEDPRLVPLVTRVLFAAGMTGQDPILTALGTALGDAVRDRSRIDEAELLLIGIADLRAYHIAILKIMSEEPPAPDKPDSMPRWYPNLIADRTGYRSEVVSLCIYGLISGGLARSLDTYGGTSYEITELGRTALEVISQLNDDQRP